MEHLALEIFNLPTADDPNGTGSQYAMLEEDATITITDTSEIFASGDVWSYSFTLNAEANAHILGTAADLHGSRLHEQLDRRKARLWVDSVPMYLGYLRLDDEAEVDGEGNVDVRFESGQKTFEDMIDGAKANQVPMMDDIRFGVALWRKRKVGYKLNLMASATVTDGTDQDITRPENVTKDDSKAIPFSADGEEDFMAVQEYPRMVFPKGTFKDDTGQAVTIEGCINTDSPYTESQDGTPTHPYCNVALCYQKYGYKSEDKDGNISIDYSGEPVAQRGYEYMPADRVNSAPCFFVIYWIRALMTHLGIHIDENQMMDVEDLRRLFFVNTNCAYKEPKHIRQSVDDGFTRYRFADKRLLAEYYGPEVTTYDYSYAVPIPVKTKQHPQIKLEESALRCTAFDDSGFWPSGVSIERVNVFIRNFCGWEDSDVASYESDNCYLHDAIATSECFPDVDIEEEISFGVRFLFSDNYKRVRIVLLRNVFRSDEVQDVTCENIITPDTKTENSIRGFRMTYGDSEDTAFYYKGFDDKLPKKKPYFVDNSDKHDYSHWNLDAKYEDIINRVTAFDKTCSVTPNTGNAYVIKVDKDAKRYDELHPSLFETAGFMDAEDGDCTGEEETIETITVGFKPAIMNDLNMEAERGTNGTAPVHEQRFALFVDDQMRPRRMDLNDGKDYDDPETFYDVKAMYDKYGPGSDSPMVAGDGVVSPGAFAVMSDMYVRQTGLHVNVKDTSGTPLGSITFDVEGYVNEGYRLYLQDNYEPNDDGVPPLESHDWGLTLGIMRGSGSDAKVDYDSDPDDEEGNDTWEIVPGSNVTAHPDTCDAYGDEFDYRDSRHVATAADAVQELARQFPESNVQYYIQGATNGYVNGASIVGPIPDDTGKMHTFLIATHRGSYIIDFGDNYIPSWIGRSVSEVMAMDLAGRRIIAEVDSSRERADTLIELCRRAYDPNYRPTADMVIGTDGVGSRYGRFSLKLRAEKLNPKFDMTKTEEEQDEPRYLEITDENLRGRGLMDQFYKEYSYWVRNARIAKRTVEMTLAQLMAIDKTKRVRVGDVTGFIRKTQYSVSSKTGLGMVEMEILYI